MITGAPMELNDNTSIFKYPDWQKTVQAALTELDKERLQQKMPIAETAIFQRMQELAKSQEDHAERIALEEASRALLVVKKEILKYPGW